MNTTEQMLALLYGPLLDAGELAAVLKRGSAKRILNAISDETFPIPTFKERGRRVAHARDVARYLERLSNEARKEHMRNSV